MSTPKLHHYLPRGYLKGFTDTAGDLWVIDREQGRVRRQPPPVTAAEQEFYTLDLEDGPERGAEKLLADTIDGPGIAAIQAIEREGMLGERAGDLARFVASLYVRTTSARAMNAQLWEQMYQSLSKKTEAPPPTQVERHELPPGAIYVADLLRDLEELRTAPRPYQTSFVQMLSLIPEIAEQLLTLEWLIAVTPGNKTFITCDCPLLITRPEGHHPAVGVGLMTPGAEKVIPLTKRMALLMWDRSATERVHVGIMDRDRLRSLNEGLVLSSERFACGSSERHMTSLLRATGVGGTPPPRRGGIVGNSD